MPDFTVDARGNRHWPPGSGQRGGRFAPKDAAAPTPAPKRSSSKRTRDEGRGRATGKLVRAQLRAASTEDLADAFTAISRKPASPGRDRALRELYDELGRREVEDGAGDQVEELVARGWSPAAAYAEVHGLDEAQLTRQERMQLVDAERRPGERRLDTIRRMYAEATYAAWRQAEADTNGHLLSPAGRAKGIDPRSLWSGQAARARKYASDELKAWWEAHGGRRTWTEYLAQFTGDRSRAQAQRLAGSGRDFGV